MVSDLPVVQGPPFLWADMVSFTLRSDAQVASWRFFAAVPGDDARVEVCRIQTTSEHLMRIADVIARMTGYVAQAPLPEDAEDSTQQS